MHLKKFLCFTFAKIFIRCFISVRKQNHLNLKAAGEMSLNCLKIFGPKFFAHDFLKKLIVTF